MDDGRQPVAVVAIREQRFEADDSNALAQLVRSVVAACSEAPEDSLVRQTIKSETAILLKSEGAEVTAEVQASWQLADGSDPVDALPRRAGFGRASDPVNAVARAAVKACRPRCELAFAGASELDDAQVTIVMIRDSDGQLRLGYAVRPNGDHSGAAEAVFTAAGANPAI